MGLGDYLKTFEIRPNAGAPFEEIRVSGFNATVKPFSRSGETAPELFDKRRVQEIDGFHLDVELTWQEMTEAQASALADLVPAMIDSKVTLRFPGAQITDLSTRSYMSVTSTGNLDTEDVTRTNLSGNETYRISFDPEWNGVGAWGWRLRNNSGYNNATFVNEHLRTYEDSFTTPASPPYHIQLFANNGGELTARNVRVHRTKNGDIARSDGLVSGLFLADAGDALKVVFETMVRSRAAGFTLKKSEPLTVADVAGLKWLLI